MTKKDNFNNNQIMLSKQPEIQTKTHNDVVKSK